MKLKRKTLSSNKRAKVWRSNNGLCFYCNREITFYEMVAEHKIPLSRGGLNNLSNLAPSCVDCDTEKGSKTAAEFFVLISKREPMF